MKTRLKFTTMLPLAVMLIATAFASTATAKDLHVEALIDTKEDHTVLVPPPAPNMPPALVRVQLEGTGCAALLGHYILTIDENLSLPAKISVGTFVLETMSGDKLSGTVIGQGTQISGTNNVAIVESCTITGGTGRFKGASGTLTDQRIVDQATNVSFGSIDATITVPDQPHCGRDH